MADIKKKGSMDKPKVKTSGFVPKEAKSIIKEKYQEQQERNAPGQKDPVRYATDHVEGGGKRVARTAGDALKQKVKKEFVRRRRKKVTQDKNTVSEQPQTSSSQPPNTPGEVLETNTDTPLDSNHFDSYGRAESPTKYYRHDLSTTSTDFSTTNPSPKVQEWRTGEKTSDWIMKRGAMALNHSTPHFSFRTLRFWDCRKTNYS